MSLVSINEDKVDVGSSGYVFTMREATGHRHFTQHVEPFADPRLVFRRQLNNFISKRRCRKRVTSILGPPVNGRMSGANRGLLDIILQDCHLRQPEDVRFWPRFTLSKIVGFVEYENPKCSLMGRARPGHRGTTAVTASISHCLPPGAHAGLLLSSAPFLFREILMPV